MKNLIILLSILTVFASCGSNKKYGANVKRDKLGAGGKVDYQPYQSAYDEKKKECGKLMLDAVACQTSLDVVPKGGKLIVHLHGSTLQSAKPENWTYILTDTAGKELFRTQGGDNIPFYTVDNRTWWGTDVVYLNMEMPKVFKLYFTNIFTDKRTEFTIRY